MPNNTSTKQIAIIGAGFTGLTTAYRLANQGYDVTIFERSETLGGLVAGFQIEGTNLEKAYHFLYKTDNFMLDLASELGVRDKIKFHASSLSTYYSGKLYPMMTPIDLLKFSPLPFIDRIRAGLTILYLQLVKNWEPFKHITAYDWLKKWAGPRVTQIIWEPLLRGKFDKYYNQVAMSWLWKRIKVRVDSKDRGDMTEKLGYFEGGWQIFVDALVSRCKELGVKIETKAIISSIEEKDASGKVGLTINGTTQRFDSIVATIPSYIFASLIEHNPSSQEDYLKMLRSVDYLGAVVMVFASTQEITQYYWHNINDMDSPFLVFLSLTQLVGTQNFNGKHIYYIGAYPPHDHRYFSDSEETITHEWFEGLKSIFPQFDRAQVSEAHVFRFKNAQHIVDLNYSERIPQFQTPLEGIFLANFTQVYPDDRGTNYAVRDGNKVAELVNQSFTH